jgi:hypothetical protein
MQSKKIDQSLQLEMITIQSIVTKFLRNIYDLTQMNMDAISKKIL